MLIVFLFSIPFSVALKNEESNEQQRYAISLPVPLDLPNRNERAKQCWLRIEDTELTETLAVYCYIVEAFLQYFIHEYNTQKMLEDKVDVSLWNEEPRPIGDISLPMENTEKDDQNAFVDWKQTTVKDPTTQRRLYVTKHADCRLIMYSRDGMTNYKVDCRKILYFVNVRMNSCEVCKGDVKMFLAALLILVFNSL